MWSLAEIFTDLQIPAGRRPLTPSEARISFIAGLVFTLLIFAAVFQDYSPKKLGLVFFALFWVPMLILHELGHAAMAHWLGWRVREIVIGFGRELWRFQLGETRISIKSAPIEGYVLPTPVDGKQLRVKSMLVYAAGPGAEFLLLGILILVFGWSSVFGDSNDIGQIALKSLALVILLGAGFNLLPFRSEGAVSDGLGILSSPFLSQDAIELRVMAAEFRAADEYSRQGDTAAALSLLKEQLARFPGNEHLQLAHAAAMSADRQDDVARDIVRLKLAGSLPEHTRRSWLHLQARIELNAEEPSFFLVDHALQAAVKLTPNAPDLMATKGASLVLRGRNEEGGNLLASAWRRNDGSADDATMLLYLATAAHRVADLEARDRFLGVFDQINRSVPLSAKLERLIPSVRAGGPDPIGAKSKVRRRPPA